MSKQLSSSVKKVQTALDAYGMSDAVIELEQTTRSAQEAADAVGCRLGQIAKSLVFETGKTHRGILVIASGANRVNTKRLKEIVSEPVKMASVQFVREKTGFVIGGVPPVGHVEQLDTYIDQDLLQYQEIWAAAGTPNSLFKLTPQDLQQMTSGRVTSIA